MANNTVPLWIEPKLFEDVLKETVVGFKQIKTFKASPLAPGENYATMVLRVQTEVELKDGSSESTSFMLKVGRDSEMYRAMLAICNTFVTENGAYDEIIPEFEEMYSNAGLQVRFGAKSYKLSTDKEYVLLEDLCRRGFQLAKRQEGLDLIHTKSVLKKMAQWHAASAVRVETKGMFPTKYLSGFMNDDGRRLLQQMFATATPYILESLKNCHNADLFYDQVEKLHTTSRVTDMFFKSFELEPNEFNVLNHGDCWVNNIMFQYDADGNLQETYFVDYQMPWYGSPAQDLLYFLLSSTKYELKLNQFDFFIKYYHDELVEHLKLLKYPKKFPSLKDIHTILIKKGIQGYTTVINVLAAVLVDPADNATLENFFSDSTAGTDFKKVLFFNERYRKHVEAILPWLLYRGALEC